MTQGQVSLILILAVMAVIFGMGAYEKKLANDLEIAKVEAKQ